MIRLRPRSAHRPGGKPRAGASDSVSRSLSRGRCGRAPRRPKGTHRTSRRAISAPRRAAAVAFLVGLALSGEPPLRGAGAAGAVEDPTLGALVARTFLQAVSDGDVETALPLCADQVDFDGTLRKGPKAIRQALLQMKRRMGGHRTVRFLVVLSLREAVARFGAPPARLRLPAGPGVLVGFARYRRLGLVAFVAPVQGRYRVVALTD